MVTLSGTKISFQRCFCSLEEGGAIATAIAAARLKLVAPEGAGLLTLFALALAALLTLGLSTVFAPVPTTIALFLRLILFWGRLDLPDTPLWNDEMALGMSSLFGPERRRALCDRLTRDFVAPLGTCLDSSRGLATKATLGSGVGADDGDDGGGCDGDGGWGGETHAGLMPVLGEACRGRGRLGLPDEMMLIASSMRDMVLVFFRDTRGEFARLAEAWAALLARGLSTDFTSLTRISSGG